MWTSETRSLQRGKISATGRLKPRLEERKGKHAVKKDGKVGGEITTRALKYQPNDCSIIQSRGSHCVPRTGKSVQEALGGNSRDKEKREWEGIKQRHVRQQRERQNHRNNKGLDQAGTSVVVTPATTSRLAPHEVTCICSLMRTQTRHVGTSSPDLRGNSRKTGQLGSPMLTRTSAG